jgi:hypothetical protein
LKELVRTRPVGSRPDAASNEEPAMRRSLPVVLGVVMTLVGALWTLQGLGYVTGSAMTGVEVWAVIGPLLAGFGVALLLVSLRR